MAKLAKAEPKSANRKKGEDSRLHILRSALQVFGKHGFDGASTRTIAEEAGANLGSIKYYFGGKDGLYRAVAEHVAEQILKDMTPVFSRANHLLKKPRAPKAALFEILVDILFAFADKIVVSHDARLWARFIMREQIDSTPAFDLLYHGVMKELNEVCAELVARIADIKKDDEQTRLRVFAILGQVLIFETSQAMVLKTMGWKSISPRHVASIRDVIEQHTARVLGYRPR